MRITNYEKRIWNSPIKRMLFDLYTFEEIIHHFSFIIHNWQGTPQLAPDIFVTFTKKDDYR